MDDSLATIAQEITMLRKLAVFALLNSGVSQDKVAGALGVSQATVSRLSGGGTKGNERAKVKKKPKR
jgi:predicted transcriptional regulator